jgi:hypothetical protein
LPEFNQANLDNAIAFNSPLRLTLAITNNSLLTSNGNWVYDQNLNKWQYSVSLPNTQVQVGTTKVDLHMLASNGLYTLPNGMGGAGIYLFDGAGNMLTGLQEYGGATYCFSESTGEMLIGWQNVGGQLMYFGEDGRLMFNVGDESAMIAYQSSNPVMASRETAGAKEVKQRAAFQNAINQYNSATMP